MASAALEINPEMPKANFTLGVLFADGTAVRQDLQRAKQHFEGGLVSGGLAWRVLKAIWLHMPTGGNFSCTPLAVGKFSATGGQPMAEAFRHYTYVKL